MNRLELLRAALAWERRASLWAAQAYGYETAEARGIAEAFFAAARLASDNAAQLRAAAAGR